MEDKKYFQSSSGLFQELLNAAETVNQKEFYLKQEIDKQASIIHKQNDQILVQSRSIIVSEILTNIAHQWRQPLNTIGLKITEVQLDMAESNHLSNERINLMTHEIQKQVLYLSKTIDDFTNFFRPNENKIIFDIEQMIYSLIGLLAKRLQAKNIDIKITRFDYDQNILHINPLEISGYPNQLGQVLMNLIQNAKDVLIERKIINPKINISWGIESVDNLYISVVDNGGGIHTEILPKIFEPYFSTKSPRIGSGIGLYMSKIVVEEYHDGFLQVQNTDNGAQFSIKIPFLNKD